jgi:hypothetical protein
MDRLDTISTKLAGQFRDAPNEKKKKAVLFACRLANARTRLEDPLAIEAIDALSREQVVDRETVSRLDALAARLDDDYLTLEERDSKRTQKSLDLYLKARAASAVAEAARDVPDDLHEAVYEAVAAVNDVDSVDTLQRIMDTIGD